MWTVQQQRLVASCASRLMWTSWFSVTYLCISLSSPPPPPRPVSRLFTCEFGKLCLELICNFNVRFVLTDVALKRIKSKNWRHHFCELSWSSRTQLGICMTAGTEGRLSRTVLSMRRISCAMKYCSVWLVDVVRPQGPIARRTVWKWYFCEWKAHFWPISAEVKKGRVTLRVRFSWAPWPIG